MLRTLPDLPPRRAPKQAVGKPPQVPAEFLDPMKTILRHLQTFAATSLFYVILGPPLVFWSLSMLILTVGGMMCVVTQRTGEGK